MKDTIMEKQKNKRLTVRLDWDAYLALKLYAAKKDLTMNTVVVEAIKLFLENK